jgi:hypothetical protein
MGDEEHNPLAQWEDLEVKKQAEIAAKQVVSYLLLCIQMLMSGSIEKNICKTSSICTSENQFFLMFKLVTLAPECRQRPLGSQSYAYFGNSISLRCGYGF